MNKLIIANWKSNPTTTEEAIALAKATDIKGAIIAPPSIFIESVMANLKNAELSTQNLFWEDIGAYTGEISWKHLNNLGIKYSIIGHSERRKYLNETDEMVNKKLLSALKAGITPILCVGENAEVRDKGIESAKEFIKNQLTKALGGISQVLSVKGSADAKALADRQVSLLVAYEPIWAIGTGKPDIPESASEMIEFIKLSVKGSADAKALADKQVSGVAPSVLYGGSVKAENAESFFKEDNIDGALVGGASLNPEEFKKIIEITQNS